MNAFKLAKHSLVSILSFSNRKNKRKSSFWMSFLISFFRKSAHLFYVFFENLIPILDAWRVNWKYYLISYWNDIRIKIAPKLWLLRDTMAIILTHMKATILPFLWDIRYRLVQFLTPNKVNPTYYFERNKNAIDVLKQQRKALPAAFLMQVNDKLMRFCPPSVKSHLERGKEEFAFLWMLILTRQLTKKQTIITWMIIVVCSMAHIRKADSLTSTNKPIRIVNGMAIHEFKMGGTLQTTLYNSLKENGLSQEVIAMVKEALKGKLDFRQCTQGDEYKLIWDEIQQDEQSETTQQLTSIYYKRQNVDEPIYVFYYVDDILSGWFGEEGLPKQGCLDAPVKNGKLTSRFDWNRRHPILGYRRPHLGTDYAAPRGTPIMSVADGVVEEARFRNGNGRYVKIKHSATYETEYLHMSRFGEGIKQGEAVKKKQILGYIGMSGLTTGPHVCFRVLKHGKPIDHLIDLFFTDEDNAHFEEMVIEKKAQLNIIDITNHIQSVNANF